MLKLPFLKCIPVDVDAGEIPIYIEVLCNERERLIQFLANRGIQARPFYPDLNLAKYFNNSGKFPHSKVFGAKGLFLPSGPEQPLENIDHVEEALFDFGKNNGFSC
jgi:dTDP-4-amino-4,6-dideoxygalactose transaminase